MDVVFLAKTRQDSLVFRHSIVNCYQHMIWIQELPDVRRILLVGPPALEFSRTVLVAFALTMKRLTRCASANSRIVEGDLALWSAARIPANRLPRLIFCCDLSRKKILQGKEPSSEKKNLEKKTPFERKKKHPLREAKKHPLGERKKHRLREREKKTLREKNTPFKKKQLLQKKTPLEKETPLRKKKKESSSGKNTP